MYGVTMPVVDVIQVISVLYRQVAAPRAVDVSVRFIGVIIDGEIDPAFVREGE